MDLTHSFVVPLGIEATWEHFQDIGALAECFPGAQVTAVGEDAAGNPTFEGTCKVKLGPIALVYAGAGAFVENDPAVHRFVVDAKGRDKRGNGTAGAKVTVTMSAAGESTQVEVVTDLAITGKPAQFGRGVMQDVSDKLLGQFVACLEQRLAAEEPDAGEASSPADSSLHEPIDDERAGDDARPEPPRPVPQAVAPPPPNDDALDLGSAVLPVLLKTYGKQVALVLGVLAGVVLLRRRRRR